MRPRLTMWVHALLSTMPLCCPMQAAGTHLCLLICCRSSSTTTKAPSRFVMLLPRCLCLPAHRPADASHWPPLLGSYKQKWHITSMLLGVQGVYARGGPTNVDGGADLSDLCDRR